jgi:hypothetical protein
MAVFQKFSKDSTQFNYNYLKRIELTSIQFNKNSLIHLRHATMLTCAAASCFKSRARDEAVNVEYEQRLRMLKLTTLEERHLRGEGILFKSLRPRMAGTL